MNEPITTTQAHKLFGELYKKQRPPELQQKVDEIIEKYKDVYIRIKKIQELDEAFTKQIKQNKINIDKSKKNNNIVNVLKKEKNQKKNKGSFFQKVLGGNELSRWGSETGTFIHGLFGLNLNFSQQLIQSFHLFEEKQILDTLKSLGFFIQKGWMEFPPQKYNIIVTLFQFFREYINIYPLFKSEISPDFIIQKTLKMQVLYANLIQFPDYTNFIENQFAEWLKKEKDIAPYYANTISVVKILSRMEQRRPKFTDIILSFYVLQRKKIIKWNDLIRELNIKPPVIDRYRAPDKIMQLIHQRISKLQQTIDEKQRLKKDIIYIKNKYFIMTDKGKVNFEFLNDIVIYILKRQYGEMRVGREMVQSHINEPQKLLNILFTDFDLNFNNLYTSTISIYDQKNQTTDVMIFKNSVFKKEMDLYSEINKDIKDFLNQYKTAVLSFQNLYTAMKGSPTDIILQNFIKIIVKSNNFFRKMINHLRTIINNHEEATELERTGHLKESLQRSKIIPIENISLQPRFIPYYNYKISSVGRINEKTVLEVIEENIRDFYNYLYLFKDASILELLNSIPKIDSEIELTKKKLLQLGIELKI